MAQNITLLGASYSDVPAVTLPKTGGGTATFTDTTITSNAASASDILSGKLAYVNGTLITGTGSGGGGISVVTTQDEHGGDIVTITAEQVYPYNPLGEQAELVASYPKQSFILKNTAYNGWTPSTTAKSIQATASLGTYAADMGEYEYFTKMFTDAKIEYADGTTLSGAVVRQLTEVFQYIYRKPSNLTNVGTQTDNYNYCTTIYTSGLCDYYSTTPSHTMGWTASYGFYGAGSAHTFSNSTSTTPTITIKRPVLTARCSTTYLTTTMAAAVDQDNSTIDVWGYLYRCKKGSFGWAVWRDLIAQYNA